MAEPKTPKQPTHEEQQELQELLDNTKHKLILSNGKKIKIGFLCPDTQDKIDSIIIQHDNIVKAVADGKISIQKGNTETRKFYAKMTAAILINNYFGLRLLWGLKWRIIHHFWKLNGQDYKSIIEIGKKKAMEQEYYLAMVLSMTMSDIWTMMTKKEAEAFHRELNSVKEQQP